MVVNSAKKAVIDDRIFEKEYFGEFINEICSWEEYKQLKDLVDKTGYFVRFGFSKTKQFFKVTYFIEIEICDSSNCLIAVPEDSIFYDVLFNLCASGSVLFYNILNHRVLKKINREEIKDDFYNIIDYLSKTNTGNASAY